MKSAGGHPSWWPAGLGDGEAGSAGYRCVGDGLGHAGESPFYLADAPLKHHLLLGLAVTSLGQNPMFGRKGYLHVHHTHQGASDCRYH